MSNHLDERGEAGMKTHKGEEAQGMSGLADRETGQDRELRCGVDDAHADRHHDLEANPVFFGRVDLKKDKEGEGGQLS